jgi:hypothetical protein
MFNTVLPPPLGYINGEAVFISTRPALHPARINQLVDHYINTWSQEKHEKPLNRKDLLDKMLFKHVKTHTALLSSVYHLEKLTRTKKNVSWPI